VGKQALVIALDWVQVGQLHTLSAVAVAEERAVPLLWASYMEGELYTSQNNLEEGLLRLLRTMPEETFVIILADGDLGVRSWPVPASSWASIT